MKKALILSLLVNALVIGFIIYRKVRMAPAGSMLSASYASNPQYDEQLNIVDAYEAPCDIALIGDSHIYKCHWSELLGFSVCNRGVGSDITEGMYRRIGTVINAKPKICFIMSGANDIEKKITVDSMVYWYKKMVDTLNAAGLQPVVMLSTPVSSDYPDAERWNKDMSELNARVKQLGNHISIVIGPGDLQKDGIHLTAAGYLKWKKSILEHIKK